MSSRDPDLTRDINRALKNKVLTARALARICGQLISMSKAILPAKLLVLQNFYSSFSKASTFTENVQSTTFCTFYSYSGIQDFQFLRDLYLTIKFFDCLVFPLHISARNRGNCRRGRDKIIQQLVSALVKSGSRDYWIWSCINHSSAIPGRYGRLPPFEVIQS